MVRDHLNNEFASIKEMCKFYNIGLTTYKRRRAKGMTIEEILTAENRLHSACEDHLGNHFESKQDMCDYYNISKDTLNIRLKKGIHLKDILTKSRKRAVKDHLGNPYNTILEMCEAYNISYSIYQSRRKANMSLEEILTTPVTKRGQVDPYGNKFATVEDMCKVYNRTIDGYAHCKQRGYSQYEGLGIIPILSSFIKDCEILDITILNVIDKRPDRPSDFYMCLHNDHEVIMSHKQIIDYVEQHKYELMPEYLKQKAV